MGQFAFTWSVIEVTHLEERQVEWHVLWGSEPSKLLHKAEKHSTKHSSS